MLSTAEQNFTLFVSLPGVFAWLCKLLLDRGDGRIGVLCRISFGGAMEGPVWIDSHGAVSL